MTVSTKPAASVNGKSSSSQPSWKFWERQKPARPEPGSPPVEAPLNGAAGIVATSDGESTTRVEFQIKHWVKGRLRVMIPRLAHDEAYGELLQYRITATSSAFRVRVNPGSRSLVIEYNPEDHVASELLERVVICIEDAAQPELAIERSQPTVEESEYEINYTKRLGLPGIALGMAVASSFMGVVVPPLLIGGTLIVAAIPCVGGRLNNKQ